MNTKERILRILLIILAIAVPVISVIYTNATGNYFGDIGSKLVVSISIILIIGALLIGINRNRNPKSKSAKIGAISGLTVLLILRWI